MTNPQASSRHTRRSLRGKSRGYEESLLEALGRGKMRESIVRKSSIYLFVIPALSLYSVFIFYPMLHTLILSFHEWNGATITKKFVGFGNYVKLVYDNVFLASLGHNVIWLLITVVLGVSFSLLVAVLLGGKTKGKEILMILYYLPAMIPPVAVGIIWTLIYHPQYGILNSGLRIIGLDFLARPWLGQVSLVLPALVATGIWTYFGFCTILFVAGLQNIDPVLYDAAKIDGASRLQEFLHITLPLLKNMISLVIVFTTIVAFKVFDIVWAMTQGGPYHKTEVITSWVYKQAFESSKVGYGSAMSITLLLIILLLTVGYLSFAEKGEK